MYSLACQQIICKPTRVLSNSVTIIDHIYSGIVLRHKVLPSIIFCEIFDHFPIVAQITSLNCKHKYEPKIMIRKVSNEKIDLFLNELNSRINLEDVAKRNDIGFLIELMPEPTDK